MQRIDHILTLANFVLRFNHSRGKFIALLQRGVDMHITGAQNGGVYLTLCSLWVSINEVLYRVAPELSNNASCQTVTECTCMQVSVGRGMSTWRISAWFLHDTIIPFGEINTLEVAGRAYIVFSNCHNFFIWCDIVVMNGTERKLKARHIWIHDTAYVFTTANKRLPVLRINIDYDINDIVIRARPKQWCRAVTLCQFYYWATIQRCKF